MQRNNTPLIVGRIGKIYGVKGWLKIFSFTRPTKNIFSYSPWFLEINDTSHEINFEEFRKHGENFLVKFLGVDNPEDASKYINRDIAITEQQLPQLKDGEHYWRDLISLKVINQHGILLGKVTDLIETGANDVFVVTNKDNDKHKILIPYIKGIYIHNIDLSTQTMNVDWELDD
tara:strand:- start:1677 stop:2198 length:522 start_codon:yes stop_codon:yes gene_type:complete